MQVPYFDDTPQSSGFNQQREKGGLIPITTHILNQSRINSEEGIEYKGNLLSDICLVGYILQYTEQEANIKVKIWDQTGIADVIFYNKNESESASEFGNFNYDGPMKPIKIFGTAKVYKKDKVLQGAKLLHVSDNDLFYHFLEVVNDWLYLTGRLNELKKERMKMNDTNSNSNIQRSNSYGTTYQSGYNTLGNKNIYDIAQEIIADYVRTKGNLIEKNELNNILQKQIGNEQIASTIEKLSDDGYIVKEDESHYHIL